MEMFESYLLRVFRETERLNKEQILSELTKVKAPRLLDCGCGDGSFTAELAVRVGASDVHGVEIDEARSATAQSLGIDVALRDLNQELPYEDESFDVVHSNQVIEHLTSSDHFLRENWRVLKPGGVALVSTNNLASWHNIISLVAGMQPPPAHASSEVVIGNPLNPLSGTTHPTPGDSHLRLFSYRGLRDACEYHRFKVKRLQGVGYYPLSPTLATWATRVDRWHGAFLIATLAKE